MSKPTDQTKAAVPAPARKTGFMGQAVPPAMPAKNMKDALKDMSFKVDAEFHRRYKSAAALSGLQMKDILEQSFELWLQKNKMP